jgi:hypothetical protein
MTLPATLIEAEALEFARREIARYRDGTNPWSDDSPLTAEAGRAALRHIMRQASLENPVHRMILAAWGRAGDPDADAVLRTLLIEYQSRGERPPTELANYNMEVLQGGFHQPPARKKKNNLIRNICIATTVAAVIDRYGLRPTGRSPHCRSACSIVAEALGEAQMQLGNKAVEKIWEAYGRAMPTVPGWAST